MKHMLQICCKNNNISKEFPIGEFTFGYLLRF